MQRHGSGVWIELLPWAGCHTVCDECQPIFCEPCDPTLRALGTGESQAYAWDGFVYSSGDDLECDWEGSLVPCIERREALAGRYRVELCFSPDYVEVEEQFGACRGGEGYVSPASLDSPECVIQEFAYDPCDVASWELFIVAP